MQSNGYGQQTSLVTPERITFTAVKLVTNMMPTEISKNLSRRVVFNLFFILVPPDVISPQLVTPKVVGAQFKLYKVYNLHLKN
jgi:hypothetical protein